MAVPTSLPIVTDETPEKPSISIETTTSGQTSTTSISIYNTDDLVDATIYLQGDGDTVPANKINVLIEYKVDGTNKELTVLRRFLSLIYVQNWWHIQQK